uniref:Uncharacterized protein n=1 Tax=Rhizophora mucronata TaxID=61149 RepID=A0A2P2J1D3_RHIMU
MGEKKRDSWRARIKRIQYCIEIEGTACSD